MDEKKRRGRPPKDSANDASVNVHKRSLGGRPSKYDESIAERLPDMFKDGQSVLEVSVQLGVSRDTLYEWAKVHPEFSDALTRGKAISQAWWEKIGRENLFDESEYDAENKVSTTKKFNEKLWNKNVSCRFRDDWTDKQEIALDASMEIKHTFDPEGI